MHPTEEGPLALGLPSSCPHRLMYCPLPKLHQPEKQIGGYNWIANMKMFHGTCQQRIIICFQNKKLACPNFIVKPQKRVDESNAVIIHKLIWLIVMYLVRVQHDERVSLTPLFQNSWNANRYEGHRMAWVQVT